MTYNRFSFVFAQIKYGYSQHWTSVSCSANFFSLNILKALKNYHLINGFFFDLKEKNLNKRCIIFLKYKQGKPLLAEIDLISRPGSMHPISKFKLHRLLRRNPNCLYFLNTSNGIVAYNLNDLYVLNFKKDIYCGFLLFKVEIW